MYVTQISSSCSSDRKRRQSNLCYRPLYARLLSMLLVVVCFVTSIIPAEAAESELLMCDLFTASAYKYYSNGVLGGTQTDPTLYFRDVKKASWEWTVTTDYTFKYCYFTVSAARKPDTMLVKYYATDTWVTAECIGNNGNTYQYRATCGSNNAQIFVEAVWNSTYTGNFNVYSFVGVDNFSNNISKVDVSHDMWRIMYATGNIEIADYGNASGVSLPYSRTSTFTVNNYKWNSSVHNIDITPDYRSYDHVSEVSFLLSGYALSAFSIQLIDSMKTAVYVVEPEVSSVTANTVLVGGDNDQPVVYYQVTADLSNYDLEGLTVRLTYSASPYDKNDTQQYISYSILDCFMNPYIEKVPWYKTFWNWLTSKWDKVTNTITSSISSAATKISNAFSGNSSQNQALNQAGQAMSDQADSMNQAQDELNSVDKPSVDPDNLFGDMLTFDTGGLRVLSAITSNGQVTAMLVVVFTFALCGYIFFGKKG